MTIETSEIRPGFLGRIGLPLFLLLTVGVGVLASLPVGMIAVAGIDWLSGNSLYHSDTAGIALGFALILASTAGTFFILGRERRRQIETAQQLRSFWVETESALTSGKVARHSTPSAATKKIPADWRQRLRAILDDPRLLQLSHIPSWELWLRLLGKFVIAIEIGLITAYLLASVFGGPSYVLRPGYVDGLPTSWPVKANDSFTGGLIIAAFVMPMIVVREIWKLLSWAGRNASRAIAGAKSPPVLFLRSFAFDRLVASPGGPSREQGLMRFLMHQPRRRIVLAIGQPRESEPPYGAIRIYVRHDAWQEKVQAIAEYSSLVVWTTGHTEGLRWEITYLLKTLLPERLLLWVHVHASGSAEERRREWRLFLDNYRPVFPKPLPDNVERVAFIAFDSDWNAISVAELQQLKSLLRNRARAELTSGA